MDEASVLRLVGRSSSHFTRVAAMAAIDLGLRYQLEVVHDLGVVDPAAYGGNPALKVPALLLPDGPLVGTENIVRRLVEHAGRLGDARIVLTEHLTHDRLRSAQELVWGAMATQITLRIGIHVAGLPAENPFFRKAEASMRSSLGWLESELPAWEARLPAGREWSLLEHTTFALVEHLAFRPSVPVDGFPNLAAFAARYRERASARATPYRFDPAT